MYIQVSIYKFWISIRLQYHYMIIISLGRNTVYCGTSLKCEDLECLLCNSPCSIWCRSKAFKICVTVWNFVLAHGAELHGLFAYRQHKLQWQEHYQNCFCL